MKKKVLIVTFFALACFVAVTFSGSVKAATLEQLTTWGHFEKTAGNPTVYKLKNDAELDIRVGIEANTDGTDTKTLKTENVVIDLNGHKLTNYTKECEAIKVFEGSTLTIKDTSNDNKGVITQKTDSTYSVITNGGTLNIESGTVIVSKEFYAIRNEGKLNISGGQIMSISNNTSTIGNIENSGAELVVSGNATISSTSKKCAIKNNAGCSVTVNGGTVMATFGNVINSVGGNVKVTDGSIIGGDVETGAIYAKDGANIEVSGGSISSGKSAVYAEGENSVVKLTGGKFTAKEGVTSVESADVIVSGKLDIPLNTTDEDSKYFDTKSGDKVLGKYSDISFKILLNNEEVKDTLELVIGEKSDISAKAYLKGYELVEQIKLTSKDSKIATFEDGKIKGVEKGETTLTLQLGDKTQDIKVTVVEAKAKDNTPKTGMTDYIVYISLVVALVALGGIYTVKKLVK